MTDKERIKNKIRKLVNKGLTYPQINKKLNIVNSGRIARRMGIKKNDKDSQKWVKIVNDINSDIDNGLPYNDLKIKYEFNTYYSKYRYHGLPPIYNIYSDIRDGEITKQYKFKIAKEVLKSDAKEIGSPKRFHDVNSIYRSSSKNGFRKYPKIERGKSGLFVEKGVINIIKKGRLSDKKKTYKEIAEILNDKGFMSPMGYPYNEHMVSFKWTKIKKLKL